MISVCRCLADFLVKFLCIVDGDVIYAGWDKQGEVMGCGYLGTVELLEVEVCQVHKLHCPELLQHVEDHIHLQESDSTLQRVKSGFSLCLLRVGDMSIYSAFIQASRNRQYAHCH